MSVAAMSKVNIFFKANDHSRVVEQLQNLDIVQINDSSVQDEALKSLSVEETSAQVEYLRAGIKFCIDYLLPFEEKTGSFLDRAISGKMPVSRKIIKETIEQSDYPLIIEAVQNLETAINETQNKLAALKEEQVELEPWRTVPFIINHKLAPQDYDFILVLHPNEGYDLIRKSLMKDELQFESGQVGNNGKLQYFYIVYNKASGQAVEEIIQNLGGEIVEVSNMEVLVPTQLQINKSESSRLEQQLTKLKKEVAQLAHHIPALRIGYDYYLWASGRVEVLGQTQSTQSTVILNGWIEKENIAKLEKSLHSISKQTAVLEVEFDDEEEPPVLMRNKKWASPFEAITNIYGSPQYNEPDPTPWLAPFFIVFFGLALTDTGYGIILSVLALLGLKYLAHTDEAKKLMKVLVITGISTAILGVLFGGWMGIQLDALPEGMIKQTLLGVRLIDPITSPITVLILSFALGALQVLVGLFVSLRWQLQHGDKKEAILGSGVWLGFLVILILWVLAKASVIPAASLSLLQPLLLAGVAVVVISGFRKTKNWFLKLPIGLVGLYDLVGYFSDVLSYSRLLALGLGTGIIAMVVNMIAFLAVDMIPYVGWVFFVLIMIGGHAFNIAINVLGAYIHSSRLQFVEFFPKFMEGGGKVFSTFKKESQYIRLTD